MTVPASDRRAGPFLGTGIIVNLPFTFKVFAQEDLVVTQADDDGVETVLALGVDYTVTLNADQNTNPGGVVVPLSTPAVGTSIVLTSGVPESQLLALPGGGSFRPDNIEAALDRATILIQQLREVLNRTLRASVASDVDVELPAAEAGKFLAWNGDASALVNADASDLATVVINGTSYIDLFNGNDSTTQFTLTAAPGSTNALMVVIGGVVQTNGVDFTVSGTTLTFTSPPPTGVDNVFARYVAAIPAGTANAQDVTFTSRATGAVSRPVDDELDDHGLNVKSMGAVGDGVAVDYSSIVAAFASGEKRIVFPAGTYHLGDWATSARIFDLTALGDGITVVTLGDVEFTVNTTANVNPVVFYLRANNHFHGGRLRFRDLNYSRVASRGLIGFTLDAFGADWADVKIDGIYAKDCYAAFLCATQSATRVRGIKIGQLIAIDCNRGANFQNQGDGVVIDQLYAERCERAYFAYGVTGHRANIFTRANYGTTGSVNIARTVGGYDTSDIRLNYVSRDNTVDLCHVLINHIDLLGGEISGIKVHVDIRGSAAYDPVRIVNYTGSGGSETAGASSNYVSDIELSGSCDAQARDVEVVASYAAARRLTFTPGRFFQFDDSLPAAFSLAGGGLYSPIAAAWTAVSVNPSLGDGTLTRNHSVVGNICFVNYDLVAGASTTFGTGDWIFSAPVAAASGWQGAAYLLDSGTATYVGVARITAGSSEIKIYPDNGATALRSNTPFVWASGDRLSFSLSYPISV